MLWTYFLIVALLGYHAQGASIKQNDSIVKKRLLNTVQAKCSANSKEDKYEEVANAITHLQYCWDRLIPDLSQPWEKSQQVCFGNVPQRSQCITTFLEKIEDCLVPEEHFLKDFIVEGYAKYYEAFCENIKTLFCSDIGKTNTQQCIQKFMFNAQTNPHYVCYAESKFFGEDASHEVITKPELCQDLNNVRTCYERMFEEHCPDAPEVKEYTMRMIKAGLLQCSREN